MSSQRYRGYLIQVSSAEQEGLFAYRTTIIAGDTGTVRYQDSSSRAAAFSTQLAAEDHAFRAARAWAELHPNARAFDV